MAKYLFRIGATPWKQQSNEFVNTFISMVILAKTMKSPMAFGSACNCDDVPDICFMQRTGTSENTEYTEVAKQGTKKSGWQGSTEHGKCTEAGH